MKRKQPHFYLNFITCVLVAAYTWNVSANEKDTQTLETINVSTQKPKERKDNEVTGLGKIVKTAESISREQVLSIRDLTRYDPGISVVEQGRGASSGYSIRGMDRNRVALNVDGLPQSQSYMAQRPMIVREGYAGTGAINELEYENVKAIEISKGASSSEYGNGALAGAVAFQTKTADDVIREGESWGLQTKNAYSGKNKSFTHSLAIAGKNKGFEALLIYTDRTGKETQVHKDALRGVQHYKRRLSVPNNENNYFVLQDECPSGDYDLCKVNAKPMVSDVVQMEAVSPSDYTGEHRIAPNPMKYGSQSWFFRPGYHFSDRHYLGGVLEYTKQKYDTRDMTIPAYIRDREQRAYDAVGIYHGNNYQEYQYSHELLGFAYGRGIFYDEHHKKSRIGMEYIYQNPQNNGWIDKLKLSFDRQNIALNSYFQQTHCSPYPSVSKSCRPDVSKPYSYYFTDRHLYTEKHNVIQLHFEKKIDTSLGAHQFGADVGLDYFQSNLKHSDYQEQRVVASRDVIYKKGRNGYQPTPYYYRVKENTLTHKDYCDYVGDTYNYQTCTGRKIKGKSYYLAVRDNMALTRYIDLGIGGRYDVYKTHTDDPLIAQGHYRQFSWNSGIVLKPTDWLDLSYRISTGFRVPSFDEFYGWRAGLKDAYVAKLEPEKSRNQEWGVTLKGDVGSVEVSYFSNAYRDLIAFGESLHKDGKTGKGDYGFHNVQNAKLVGVNVLAQLDWHQLWNRIPYGLYSTFAYNRMKVKDRQINPYLGYVTNTLFDTIQPTRYVVALGYDHPSSKWGVNATYTHSAAKSNSELLGTRALGAHSRDVKATKKLTRPWHTVDLSGYIALHPSAILRLGVYNLFNYRYVTWESVRQSAEGAVNQHYGVGNYARYAAPGRNYAVTLEMKF